MTSYLTQSGKLVFHYDKALDNYREAEQAALIKHNLINAKITTIAVTPETDFIRRDNSHKKQYVQDISSDTLST